MTGLACDLFRHIEARTKELHLSFNDERHHITCHGVLIPGMHSVIDSTYKPAEAMKNNDIYFKQTNSQRLTTASGRAKIYKATNADNTRKCKHPKDPMAHGKAVEDGIALYFKAIVTDVPFESLCPDPDPCTLLVLHIIESMDLELLGVQVLIGDPNMAMATFVDIICRVTRTQGGKPVEKLVLLELKCTAYPEGYEMKWSNRILNGTKKTVYMEAPHEKLVYSSCRLHQYQLVLARLILMYAYGMKPTDIEMYIFCVSPDGTVRVVPCEARIASLALSEQLYARTRSRVSSDNVSEVALLERRIAKKLGLARPLKRKRNKTEAAYGMPDVTPAPAADVFRPLPAASTGFGGTGGGPNWSAALSPSDLLVAPSRHLSSALLNG